MIALKMYRLGAGGLQMQFEGRKADLAMFKERAEALCRAVVILEEGIAASRAQVNKHGAGTWGALLLLTVSLCNKLV